MKDLWPDTIGTNLPDTSAPVFILREQAALLGKKTKNLVIAEVETNVSPKANEHAFIHDFYIVAPTLNYRDTLFYIVHGTLLYPISMYKDSDCHEAETEEVFTTVLELIFHSAKTKQIINALISQMETI